MEFRNSKSEIENRKSKILFVHNHLATFVRTDRELLAEKYRVRERFQRGRAVNLVALQRAVASSDLVFGWFASWHTFFPVLLASRLRKPSILVVGGYDSANLPEIGYGSMRGGFKRRIAQTTMQRATQLITHSEFTRREVIQSVGIPAEKIEVIYLGFPPKPTTSILKEKMVLTIGNVLRENLLRKGIAPFVRAASELSDIPFWVVGRWSDDAIAELKSIASPNVTFTGFVDENVLDSLMTRAQVYVQASLHEGFGSAVAEAMLYECIPVVTRAGSLPEVVGDAGIYAESNKPQDMARAIQHALTLDASWGERARERIIQEFPMDARREKLFCLIDRLLADV